PLATFEVKPRTAGGRNELLHGHPPLDPHTWQCQVRYGTNALYQRSRPSRISPGDERGYRYREMSEPCRGQKRRRPMPAGGSMRIQIGELVIATSIVQLANGFFGTFISLRVAIEDFDAAGLVLSAYFAGFTVGALRAGKIIERIGHIRAYAA